MWERGRTWVSTLSVGEREKDMGRPESNGLRPGCLITINSLRRDRNDRSCEVSSRNPTISRKANLIHTPVPIAT